MNYLLIRLNSGYCGLFQAYYDRNGYVAKMEIEDGAYPINSDFTFHFFLLYVYMENMWNRLWFESTACFTGLNADCSVACAPSISQVSGMIL